MPKSKEKNCSEGWKAYRRENCKASRKKQREVNIEYIKVAIVVGEPIIEL